jgi:hypothetical protein
MAARLTVIKMSPPIPLYYLAAAGGYGCQGYGTTSYNSACDTAAAGTTSASNAGPKSGILQNTGAGALLPLVVSIALITAALLLFFKRARN